jgi:hypothetical protein
VENKMKKLAISVLAIAVTCCGVSGMEIQEHYETESNEYPTYTKLYPKEFWTNESAVNECFDSAISQSTGKFKGRYENLALCKDHFYAPIIVDYISEYQGNRGINFSKAEFFESLNTLIPYVKLNADDVLNPNLWDDIAKSFLNKKYRHCRFPFREIVSEYWVRKQSQSELH